MPNLFGSCNDMSEQILNFLIAVILRGQKTNLFFRCTDMICKNENLFIAYTELVGFTDLFGCFYTDMMRKNATVIF